MSLDVALVSEEQEIRDCYCCQCGNRHKRSYRTCYYSGNITHNLGGMAEAAGIYMELWRPEEIGISKAQQLIEPLERGLERLKQQPAHYRRLNPQNKWGDYEMLVSFVEGYLKACKDHPNSVVEASR